MVVAKVYRCGKTTGGGYMTGTLDFKKINKTLKIFGVAQVGLVALLVYMAVNFQTKLRLEIREYRFLHGVLLSFAVQLLLLYPIYRFATKEANRDIAVSGGNISSAQLNDLAKKKRWSDIIKIATLGFFVVFVTAAPNDTFILSIIYYSFILTILTYLQCYNFAARKIIREQGTD
jgi:high-affinity Fe2+/Pb2+ permease